VLDFDATDDALHGQQEGRFFHGYYGGYCYLPLYCFCVDIPLWAQLRTADRDGSDGTLAALQKIVAAIRERFGKHVAIIVRGDSGFCRDELITWIEAQEQVTDSIMRMISLQTLSKRRLFGWGVRNAG